MNNEENDQLVQRRSKLANWRAGGRAYPNDFRPDARAGELHARHGSADLSAQEIPVRVAGRVMSRRIMGKASFAHLQDQTGRIQLFVTREALGEAYETLFKDLDLGDIVGASGRLFHTKTGELSVRVDALELLAKGLRPLPEKYHGLSDLETRYRQRYVDLIVNEESRRTFRIRAETIAFIRRFLSERGYLEVETPMMQPIPGGALARPFVTHHNALDMDLYLRIAPELYLKRLVVGGFERVFEINRNFRNEGISTQHNPEFTMLEFYQAYADYRDLMDLTETMLRELSRAVLGSARVSYQGTELDLDAAFTRLTVKEAILRFNPQLGEADVADIERLTAYAERLGIEVHPGYGLGKLQTEVFEKTVEQKLVAPTFITEYPTEVSPLARRNDKNPEVTDRFELIVCGREIANGFSELNDPEDQAERFRRQAAEKARGDEEAMHYDADYIRALEYGLPPTAGEGIGIDRLVMLLTDSPSIRDVLLFPHLRPEA
jgi:lysyl-tRNA synthetase class 2